MIMWYMTQTKINKFIYDDWVQYTDLYRNSGDSPELLYANDAMTTNIHVVIPVIDQNYNINGVVRQNLA